LLSFLIKRNVIAKSMDNLLPMQEKEKKNEMFVSQEVKFGFQGILMLYSFSIGGRRAGTAR